MNLGEIREKIDQTDMQLVKLINQRMEYVLRAGKLKEVILDKAREEQVLRQLLAQARGLIRPEFITTLYESILTESKALQERNLKLVGFQGEHGAWGELAIRSYADDMIPIPCVEFAHVFEGVRDRELDMGMVPVENSLEGAVTEVNDILVDTDLKIIGEIRIPVRQCLLVLPGGDYRDIKVVYSHPQALAQCRSFLSRNKLEPRPFYDTAGAARWLAQERPSSTAVIASPIAAELYGLDIVKEDIGDNTDNFTRFLLISRNSSPVAGNKCSLVFSTEHRAGALFEVLHVFAENEINLTRIESRPIRRNPGAYAFLLDFLGREDDPVVQQALEKIREKTPFFRILGFYPESPTVR
ncbi:prephenate dehydratase [Syntrophus aciditrophicus]|uniref:Bifunctional chorismate mutase/prephenate dehydratase n=1 Tax=Syntrophus aciditrophicus (strain SB) TaxID=56780 RepID=Q2LY31_SYNAS|nr:prephenate dehydratase [Syntrophus aciditrophicus]ABC78988.1 prephenate dehydratase [Syntrophus aciditrophicus SB]